jgi:hypothetical protein
VQRITDSTEPRRTRISDEIGDVLTANLDGGGEGVPVVAQVSPRRNDDVHVAIAHEVIGGATGCGEVLVLSTGTE